MAEFALGLTKTAVEGTLIRVKSAIDEEAKLKVQVQNDLLFISGEFQMMQSFLKLASKERAKNQVVLTWVRQIRDLAFDVEDCVEFVVHLDKPSQWDWVRRLASSVIVCMSRQQLPLDIAVADIKQLRTRVEDISQRNTRYNLITNVEDDSKPAVMLQATAGNTSSTTFRDLSIVWEALGKTQQITGGLKRLINNEGSRLEVISLWGSTSAAHLWVSRTFTEAYHDPEVCQHFNCRAWIKLMHPFNHDEFLKNLLTQLYATSSHHQADLEPCFRTTEEYHLIKAELMQQVKHQRYLIILEDLLSMVELDVIRLYLPDCNNGSRIVVATRQLGLALSCTGEPYRVSTLRQFSDGQSLCAFFSRVCGHNSYIAEFIWQLRRRGVMSVLKGNEEKSFLIDKVYRGIKEKSKEFEWSDFQWHVWFDATLQSSLEDFYRRLLSNFQSDDIRAGKTAAIGVVGPMDANEDLFSPKKKDVIEECLMFLSEHKCLVVLNGLGSDHWTMIKDTLLSKPTKGCILVITHEEIVARHCVDAEDRAFNNKDLEYSAVFGDWRKKESLIKRDFQKECHINFDKFRVTQFLSGRPLEAHEWREKNKLVGHHSEKIDLCRLLEGHPDVISVGGVAGVGKTTPNVISVGGVAGVGKTTPNVISVEEVAGVGKTTPDVISVWGVAGVGKTTLVKHIYYTNIINFSALKLGTFTKYSWVNVAYPFDLTDLSRSLLLDFHCDNLEAKETAAIAMMEGHDPVQECRNFMCKFKCFVVICGLRSNQDWDLIKPAFLSEPIEGCILVITNESSVATHCAKDRVINVKGLAAKAAHELFTEKLTSRTFDELSPREGELSNIILTKCGGHLKVIAAIREYCKKEHETDLETALKTINDNFMSMLEKDPRFHNLKGLFLWMQTYFDACPDSLKPCIFYLSIFPCHDGFRRRRLLRRWIAEGYSRDKSTGSTSEEDGEMLYSKLLDLSIIQKKSVASGSGSNKKVDMYQVNGFFREYIVSRPMEDNLVFSLEGHCRPNSEHTGKHLIIGRTWDRDEIVFKSMDLSRLRSLTVFGKWEQFLISDKMRLLRVLDLEDSSDVTDSDLEQIGKAVLRLKFLSLRGCKKIRRLPDSVGDMKQLQTLDVRGTQIVKLPEAVIKLKNLQYVRAGMPSDVMSTTTNSVVEATREPATARQEEDQSSVALPATATSTEEVGGEEDQLSVALPATATSTSTEEVVGGGCTGTLLRASRVRGSTGDSLASSCWLSTLMKRRLCGSNNNFGVEVVAGIGTLTALRTIGVVNVSAACRNGKAILKELKKLRQLRKLGVSGINQKNWQELCSAISGYAHLVSLSVRFDGNNKKHQKDDSFCLDISVPPKALKSLKLYGGSVQVSPFWLKQIENLRKVHLEDPELIMSTQEGIDSLVEFTLQDKFCRVCVKADKDGQLHYGWFTEYVVDDRFERLKDLKAPALKIDCSRHKISIEFRPVIPEFAELVVHSSTTGSSLELSGIHYLKSLKAVRLQGTYSNTLREYLERKFVEHENKPVFHLGD